MALHAAEMIGLLAGGIQQTPVVQCVTAAPESWIKWLLPTIVQTVVSLASIAAGVWIALWSFRSTSKSDHKRRVLDQKKAERGQLLRSIAATQRVLMSEAAKERVELMVDGLKSATHELWVAQGNCIFLQDFFANPVKNERFFSFIAEADSASDKIDMTRNARCYEITLIAQSLK